ncbi:Auxin-responsive protein [Actinidia chinensis var. chinensis]|uniref:Auxin-responsive protein n=1 Tax=Actinidia chinensis var. chinensis TaxID=1590841 RepID=A0A2R6QK66_ACTCC|nr:Auxin-responsive protein [Actinidia chinensis var. chinensis]
MDGCSSNDLVCPQLLDLISKDREWLVQKGEQRSRGSKSEEKKLELRLGPPGEDYGTKLEREDSILSLGYFSNHKDNTYTFGGFTNTGDMKTAENGWIMKNNGSQNQQFSFTEKFQTNNKAEKKVISSAAAASANPAVVPNSSQKRTAPAPVVGWPPIRSFRKNLASSSSSKPVPESPNAMLNKVSSEEPAQSCGKGFFVKINMDGVPIGRKVNLKAYDSYQKLSSAVDELFRGLLAAQRDSSASGIHHKQEGEKSITGLLDGTGEYTLVYDDNEGDRVLVGDVPWHMFVSTVRRLRVLKTSELSTLCFGIRQEKTRLDAASK